MKKLLVNGKPLLLLTLILGLSFSSCTKDWWGHEGGNGHGGGNSDPAALKGTVVYQACGLSIYGERLWIQLDNGTLIQPCAQSFETFSAIVLRQGDRVELKYSKYEGDYKQFEIYCRMAYFPFTRAIIDYINVLGHNDCKSVSFSEDYDKTPAANIMILDAQREGNNLMLKIGYSGCSKATKERFQVIAKSLITKPNEYIYEIKLIDKKAEMCEAAFTDEICIEMASLKVLKTENMTIRLVGFTTEFIF